MVSFAFHNGWMGGEFNVALFNISVHEGLWAFAIGLFGIGFALLVDPYGEQQV